MTSVPIYYVQEGRDWRAYEKANAVVDAEFASRLGISPRMYSSVPPFFNVLQPSALDGVRQPRVAVAWIGEVASRQLGLRAGYYPLKTPIQQIKSLARRTT